MKKQLSGHLEQLCQDWHIKKGIFELALQTNSKLSYHDNIVQDMLDATTHLRNYIAKELM